MSASVQVPDEVLRWLYNSLVAEYRDVNRTYQDAANTLASFQSLRPRTNTHTLENGSQALLLQIHGTLPVPFRGTTYRFPVEVWLPHAYPFESPYVYVTPTQDMVVRPGQHVSIEGRVYHPYLANWANHWDRSNIVDFLAILQGVFAKEPPVISRQHQAQLQQRRPAQASTPPPLPPHPTQSPRTPGGLHGPPQPPPPPPKATPQPPPTSNVASTQSGPPPRPPKGPGDHQPLPDPRFTSPLPPQTYLNSRENGMPSRGPPLQPLPPHLRSSHGPDAAPISPMTPLGSPQISRHPHPPQPRQLQPQSQPQQQPHQQPAPPPQFTLQQPHQQWVQQPPLPPTQHQQRPPLDLLSSPLDTPLPQPTHASLHAPPPPIPPNPEKDLLQTTLSTTLVHQIHATTSQNLAALPPLQAQYAALLTARANLQRDAHALSTFSQHLSANEAILRTAMRDSDKVINGAAERRRAAPVRADDVLVAPTAAGEQLYALVAEERGIASAMFALGRAVDRGRVGGEAFVRAYRGLAREAFLKKALIRKVGRGMGLAGV